MNLSQLNFEHLNQWLNRRQLRVLEEAYQGAQQIKALEDQYFDGGKIAHTPDRSKTVVDYVQTLRARQLLKVRTNLVQFRLSGFLLNQQPQPEVCPGTTPDVASADRLGAEVVEKLKFIDSVISKYRESDTDELEQFALDPHIKASTITPLETADKPHHIHKDAVAETIDPPTIAVRTESTRRIRFSFFRGGFSIGKELNPDYEQQVVQEIRLRRKQDKIAIRWLLILLLIPLLTQVLAKNIVFETILGNYSDRNPTRIELSREIQEEFFYEFSEFKEGLEIQELLGATSELTEAERRKRLEEKAVELWRDSREHALNGLKNVLADGVAIVVFAGIVYLNRNKLMAIRTFSNRTFLGLSDPAKVFLFILITDMFVGFHSAEGWEVLLEGIAHHFGLPESKVAINTFIATVPVILDSCVKFWIFTYLTRYSPSASAIYERMNT